MMSVKVILLSFGFLSGIWDLGIWKTGELMI